MNTQHNDGQIRHDNHAILRAYGVLNTLQVVASYRPSGAKKPILISDIFAYIQGYISSETSRVEAAIFHDLTTRRQYKQLLRVNSIAYITKPRAAQSGRLFEQRVGDNGVLLKLKQSKGNTKQYYLIIELPDTLSIALDKPLVLHVNTESQTQRAIFPPIHDGRSQIILSQNDALFELLQDHDVEVDIQ